MLLHYHNAYKNISLVEFMALIRRLEGRIKKWRESEEHLFGILKVCYINLESSDTGNLEGKSPRRLFYIAPEEDKIYLADGVKALVTDLFMRKSSGGHYYPLALWIEFTNDQKVYK